MNYKGEHSITFYDGIMSPGPYQEEVFNQYTDFNTWTDFHMIPTSRPVVTPPELKNTYVSIPGRDGDLDLTTAISSQPRYGNRTGTWEFLIPPLLSKWPTDFQRLCNALHGLAKYVILQDDPMHYYRGRLSVDDWRNGADGNGNFVTIGYNLEPFKTRVQYYGNRQKWDPFNFETDKFVEDEFWDYNGIYCQGGLWHDFDINLDPEDTYSAMVPSKFSIRIVNVNGETFYDDNNYRKKVTYNGRTYYFKSGTTHTHDNFYIVNREGSSGTFTLRIYTPYDANISVILSVRSL